MLQVKATLTQQPGGPRQVQIVTGFLGKGIHTGAITTLGRGGSDLTATVIGAAMELREVQVWKDVDGVLTSDPRIVNNTLPVTELTYDEATELAFFGAQVRTLDLLSMLDGQIWLQQLPFPAPPSGACLPPAAFKANSFSVLLC